VTGSGGREHALAWKIAQSPLLDRLYCAPGNAGTAELGENVSLPVDDFDGLIAFARDNQIDLTVVGPEAPLCAGIVDRFEAAGLRCFGPSAEAARIEGDKAFAKKLMHRAAVPTAEARVFDDFERARQYIASRDSALVVKAAGLAAGKGVIVCDEPSDGILAAERIMQERAFGDAGQTIVVEERLTGTEASVLALVDGKTIYMLEPAQDYKRVHDGDAGPNTGGMGAFCPTPAVDDKTMDVVAEEIFLPTLDALNRAGTPYRGVLYAGLMLTPGGPKVLEFNCRFGDPEAQAILPRLRGDLLAALDACFRGQLEDAEIEWDPRPAVCVVLAAPGYPDAYPKDLPITGLEEASKLDDVVVFHAGTRREGDKVVTAGGRVLGVTALGETTAAARQRAYEAVERIRWEGLHCRADIAAGVA
jgi:phosphoribosylamine--glycine ligase